MSSQEDFEAAAEEVKTFAKATDADKLILYGLFKQANVGDVEGGGDSPASPPDPTLPPRWSLTAPFLPVCPARPPRHVQPHQPRQVGRVGEEQGCAPLPLCMHIPPHVHRWLPPRQ